MISLSADLIQLKIEKEAVRKEKDEASKKRLKTIEHDIKESERAFNDLEAVWKSEKILLSGTHDIKEKIEQAKLEDGQSKSCWRLAGSI